MSRRVKETMMAWLVVVGFFLMVGLAGTWEHTYTREDCVVTAVQGDVVVAEDRCGYEWSWYIDQETDITEGDKVTLIMHTAFTHGDIDDDEVRDYKVQQ